MRLPELIAVHDQYLALRRLGEAAFAGQFGGKLLLRSGFDPDGIAVMLASSIAGAASLCIDGEAEFLREGMRAGFCDFVVGHLDEAVRILKNEVRRGRSVSVGITTEPEPCLAEIVNRGLQPNLVSAAELLSPAWNALCDRGATAVPASTPQETQLSLVEWSLDPAASMPLIARIAQAALNPQRPDTTARSRWLEHSPAYLGRVLGGRQCIRMMPQEIATFIPEVQSHFPFATVTVHSTDI